MSLTTTLRNALIKALLVFTAVAACATIAGTMTPDVAMQRPTDASRPAADPVKTLMDEHGCWSGEAPADMRGKLPGHVVATKNGRLVYGGTRMVGQALDQLPETMTGKPPVDHGLRVHGYCR